MKAKFKNSILAILMSIFILTSCNTKKSNENSKEKPKEESFITVKDALNREVKVKKDVQSVVLGFNFEEYFVSIRFCASGLGHMAMLSRY